MSFCNHLNRREERKESRLRHYIEFHVSVVFKDKDRKKRRKENGFRHDVVFGCVTNSSRLTVELHNSVRSFSFGFVHNNVQISISFTIKLRLLELFSVSRVRGNVQVILCPRA